MLHFVPQHILKWSVDLLTCSQRLRAQDLLILYWLMYLQSIVQVWLLFQVGWFHLLSDHPSWNQALIFLRNEISILKAIAIPRLLQSLARLRFRYHIMMDLMTVDCCLRNLQESFHCKPRTFVFLFPPRTTVTLVFHPSYLRRTFYSFVYDSTNARPRPRRAKSQ